uniref:Ig-like domain-containing protein n=1 Tax=Scleropages formosus TaxID=113540 RepID=A0A8C9V347_SCLFO
MEFSMAQGLCSVTAARPTVSVSQVEGPSGVPMLLCSSRNFHPAPIEQVWLWNGLPLNTTSLHKNITANTDGSFSLDTHLSLQSEHTEDVPYSCWVNHSSLSTPITVHYIPTPDRAQTADFRGIPIPRWNCTVIKKLIF